MTHAHHGKPLLGSLTTEQDLRDADAERRFMNEHHRPDTYLDAELARTRLDGSLVDASLAHSLAERAHPEPGSELAEFLVYDILRPGPVLAELELVRPAMRPDWFDALWSFVEHAHTTGHPVGHAGAEPRPMLYTTRGGTTRGAWLDATVDDRTLLDALLALPGDPDDRRWTVRARMGFYDVYPLTSPEIWLMNHIAQGIDRHGEAYAAYAEYSMQQGMSEMDFASRYRGCSPTLDHFVFDHAEKNGWLAAIAAANEVIGAPGAVSVDVDVLRTHLLANGYAHEPGPSGVHVFGPPRL